MGDFTDFKEMIDKDAGFRARYLEMLDDLAKENGGEFSPEDSVRIAEKLGFSFDSETIVRACCGNSDKELSADELEQAAGGSDFLETLMEWLGYVAKSDNI